MKNLLLCLTLGFLTACSDSKKSDSWAKENVRGFETDDPRVKVAMKSAQENLSKFIEHFKDYSNNKEWDYFIKRGFTDYETTEHMWVDVISIDSMIVGILDNEPQSTSYVHYLDTIRSKPSEIEDFIIYHGDTLMYGDYLSKRIEYIP